MFRAFQSRSFTSKWEGNNSLYSDLVYVDILEWQVHGMK